MLGYLDRSAYILSCVADAPDANDGCRTFGGMIAGSWLN
jgi:hypothetical protein